MSDPTAIFGTSLAQVPILISAVGALGTAAMGIVEALGKGLFVFDIPWARRRQIPVGLPYAGFGTVKHLIKRVGPTLRVVYGEDYASMLVGQYRAGRGSGDAPETIRQGVRLGLPYVSKEQAVETVKAVWGMRNDLTEQFVNALLAEKTQVIAAAAPADQQVAQGLAARFATALDTSVEAAFDSAEQDFQSWARFWAGVAAVSLSLVYHWATMPSWNDLAGWMVALLVGLSAVPLAPIVKDLSTSLSQALNALGQINGKASA